MQYLVFDLETTMRNTGDLAVGGFSADPFSVRNKVLCAVHYWKGDQNTDETPNSSRTRLRRFFHDASSDDPPLVVGFNVAFDLHYLLQGKEIHIRELGNVHVWDCQTVHYLLMNCKDTMPSLNSALEYYGLGKKDTTLEDALAAGTSIEDIPIADLHKYCAKDVQLTHELFKRQMEEVISRNLGNVVSARMRAYKAKILTEHSGLYLEKDLCADACKEDAKELESLKDHVEACMADVMVPNPNCSSNQQVGVYLFGGELKHKQDTPVLDDNGDPVLYKSGLKKGQQKTRKETVIITIQGILQSHHLYDRLKNNKTEGGAHKVDTETLELLASDPTGGAQFLCEDLLKIRKLEKNVNTYFKKFPQLVHDDGYIHGTFNTCATASGRESSMNPNLQNISTKGD